MIESARFIHLRTGSFAGVFGTALLVLSCAGNLDPSLGGAAGSGPQGAGGSGGAGCDAASTILQAQRCSLAGCHAADAPQGVDLMSPGLIARLLNVRSSSVGCGAVPTPYLVPGSNPAAGLLLDKLETSPPCGATMPFGGIGGPLNDQERHCIADWATAVTTGRLAP